MKRFVKFSVHEYMDMYPHTEVRMMEGSSIEHITNDALNWAESMTKNYSGGPTHFECIMTKEQANEYVVDTLKRHRYSSEAREWSVKTLALVDECYN